MRAVMLQQKQVQQRSEHPHRLENDSARDDEDRQREVKTDEDKTRLDRTTYLEAIFTNK
jgi:hypothetical protein